MSSVTGIWKRVHSFRAPTLKKLFISRARQELRSHFRDRAHLGSTRPAPPRPARSLLLAVNDAPGPPAEHRRMRCHRSASRRSGSPSGNMAFMRSLGKTFYDSP